ncbi:MAG: RNA 3'-terminal phosphate cyclase [Nitrospirae bacterium]|nr:RNA 3'-terminal phosphate cyclase [Nitrospirota bacterium]MCL5422820.1 RNA 3'-terminal phosphate cyclase [Nitrospirota bacterium]
MIEIDGSFGEGGGQILRTALSLSCMFRKPFRIINIRKGRKKPGLMPQHLTGVRAAQLLSHAEVTGDHIGSVELTFTPGEVKGGSFFFDIGTAGSTMLVLQTLIPALILVGGRTEIILKGGTHVPFSPSFHYVNEVFVPFLERLGIRILLSIESYGFYPKGGGKIRAEIFPARRIRPLTILERGRIVALKGCSGVANLPLSIAERQWKGSLEKVHSEIKDLRCPESLDLLDAPAIGQGTFIFLKAQSEHSLAGFTSLGERGKKAELVGEEAASEFVQYYYTDAALDPHLPDQLVLYLSLSDGESEFTTSRITQHLLTNLWVIGLFHEFKYSVEGESGKPGKVKVTSPRP